MSRIIFQNIIEGFCVLSCDWFDKFTPILENTPVDLSWELEFSIRTPSLRIGIYLLAFFGAFEDFVDLKVPDEYLTSLFPEISKKIRLRGNWFPQIRHWSHWITGGYGWVIVFASFCSNVIVDGIIFTTGEALVGIWEQDFKSTAMQASIAQSLLTGFYLLAG